VFGVKTVFQRGFSSACKQGKIVSSVSPKQQKIVFREVSQMQP
jgi:hypothetical protein